MMNKHEHPKGLRVKYSNFQTDLTYNEWVKKYKVGTMVPFETKYFQGNPSCGIRPMEILREPQTLWEFVQTLFSYRR